MEFLRPQLMALSSVVVMMPSGAVHDVFVVDAREKLARKTGLKFEVFVHDPIITWSQLRSTRSDRSRRQPANSPKPPSDGASKLRIGICGDTSIMPPPSW